MPKNKEQNFVLPTLDDIFSSQEMRDDAALSKIRNIETSILYTQLFQMLSYLADHKFKGFLPVPVQFIMDEFSNGTQL